MSATYRFRLEVLDQPGALARLADALASAGGNVESLDLHRPHNGLSIDEVVVTADDEWDLAGVGETIGRLDGVRVLRHWRDRPPGDPVVNALRWARAMVAAGPDDELELSRAIVEVTGAAVAWTAAVGAAVATGAGHAALVAGAPVIKRVERLPAELGSEATPEGLEPPYWLLAAADDPDDPQLVAFAARPIATAFSASETARLDALLRLRRALSRKPAARQLAGR